jgi:hypothetical protein
MTGVGCFFASLLKIEANSAAVESSALRQPRREDKDRSRWILIVVIIIVALSDLVGSPSLRASRASSFSLPPRTFEDPVALSVDRSIQTLPFLT